VEERKNLCRLKDAINLNSPVPSPLAVLTKEKNQENKEKGKEKNNFRQKELRFVGWVVARGGPLLGVGHFLVGVLVVCF
jgi:hypothetical protein